MTEDERRMTDDRRRMTDEGGRTTENRRWMKERIWQEKRYHKIWIAKVNRTVNTCATLFPRAFISAMRKNTMPLSKTQSLNAGIADAEPRAQIICVSRSECNIGVGVGDDG
jgi:uncharacterized iron-regulated protein